MKRLCALLIGLLLITVISVYAVRTKEEKNDKEGYTSVEMDRVDALKAELGLGLKITGVVYTYSDGKKTYYLHALCDTSQLHKPMNFADGEESLVLTIDGEATKFKGEKSSCEKTREGTMATWWRGQAYYAVDPAVFKKIGDAKEVKYDLISSNETFSGKFPGGLQKQFGEFASKYCGQ